MHHPPLALLNEWPARGERVQLVAGDAIQVWQEFYQNWQSVKE